MQDFFAVRMVSCFGDCRNCGVPLDDKGVGLYTPNVDNYHVQQVLCLDCATDLANDLIHAVIKKD